MEKSFWTQNSTKLVIYNQSIGLILISRWKLGSEFKVIFQIKVLISVWVNGFFLIYI